MNVTMTSSRVKLVDVLSVMCKGQFVRKKGVFGALIRDQRIFQNSWPNCDNQSYILEGSLLSTQEARVALGYHLAQLFNDTSFVSGNLLHASITQ